MSDQPASSRRPARGGDDVHVPFIVASLLLGTFGGFTLAVSLPIEVLAGSLDRSWVAHAQVHGHLQAVGFAGLFVLGMGLRLAPHFARNEFAFQGLVRPSFILVVAGLLARALGQPLAEYPPFAALLAAGAAAELIGALGFFTIFTATLGPGVRGLQPPALLLWFATFWFAVQAAFGAWWLITLAADGETILSAAENHALINMQVFGMVLSAILGVGMRTFPTFFGMPAPKPGAAVTGALLLATGVAAWTVGTVIDQPPLENGGIALLGVTILGAVVIFGAGGWRHRMAPASRNFVWALRPVLLWLGFVGLTLLLAGIRGLAGGDAPSVTGLDAIRHMFTVGVITLAIVAMAQLMLPEFASERIAHPPSQWRGPAFGAALSLAALLRGVLPWADIGDGTEYYRMMAVAGTIALLAVAAFAFLFLRARRRHVAYVANLSALRSRGASLTMSEPRSG